MPAATDSIASVRFARFALALLLAAGCGLVVKPFLPAILFSLAVAISSWPAHAALLRRLPGWPGAASLVSCLLVCSAVMAPIALLLGSLREGAAWLLDLLNRGHAGGERALLDSLAGIPLVGGFLADLARNLASDGAGFSALVGSLSEPLRRLALGSAGALANGLLQLAMAAVLLFFLYRDGEALAARARRLADLVGGPQAPELWRRAHRIVSGIMLSVVGAALAQASLATLGFAAAGLPHPLLLGALTFALSIVPVGPPLIWGGAALWLLEQGRPGWALGMTAYGVFGISSIDNVIKPFLISRTSALPFATTLLGVIGGIVAFGVTGVFIGPLLLALALELLAHRLESAPAPEA